MSMANFAAERLIQVQQVRNRLKEIAQCVYAQRQPIGKLQHVVTGKDKGPERMPRAGWKPFTVGDRWGGFDQTTWFRMRARIPAAFKGQRVVALIRPGDTTATYGADIFGGQRGADLNVWTDHLSAPGEALCYLDGVPAQGIDIWHDEVFLTEKAKGGETFELVLEAVPSTRHDKHHIFKYADLAVMHTDVWDFYWDVEVPLKVYETQDENYAPARRLLALLVEAVRMVDLQEKGTQAFHDSLAPARRFLQKGLQEFATSDDMGKLVLTGHSHIDTAWLWPLRETRRKVGRTFSSMLGLMDRYPEFHFSFSQPELYLYAKEHFPELYERIKKRVKEGRWEPCGAPWIEQDSNMAGGEALIRQFLYGNRFFREEFGIQSRTAWLPDAFGYPWSLPQIMKKCQVDTFVTTKIDWSQFTKFPYSMFQWQGADGSRITAIMPPLNYNGNPVPKDCIAQWNLFKQKERVEELPFPFGWGDGGGGPTMEMLEHGKRLKNIVGVPRCEFGRTQDCLDRMRQQCDPETLPVYNDELYLELHRACQTTQARTKRHNRKLEVLLHETEFLSTIAHLDGLPYDHQALWEAWRIVLTNQFHDILPGSSITEVYTQTEKDYAAARALVDLVHKRALAHLVENIDTTGEGTPVVVFNTLSWMRNDVARVKTKLPRGPLHVVGPDGAFTPSQRIEDDELLFEVSDLPPLGYAVYRIAASSADVAPLEMIKANAKGMENDFLRVRWDAHGRFTTIYDKVAEREVLAPGAKGNVLQLFDDRPHLHDAWDIDFNFDQERMWEPGKAEITVLERGPVRAVVRLVRKTEKSTFTQDIIMYATHPRVDVLTRVDWWEKRVLLKVAFPVDVLSSRATYDIQFATIERPTHHSTEHDRARFEVPAHQWADLSEGGYGVSLLNDCKYGYDVKDNVLRLSLLRASVDPDPTADEGTHEMLYSLYPHEDDWRNGTVQQGYTVNHPLLAVPAKKHGGALPPIDTFAALDADHVVIETLKKHEDSEAVIVRLYEAHGERGDVTLTFKQRPKSIAECDMMEENDQKLKPRGNTLNFYIKPYEIRTFKVRF